MYYSYNTSTTFPFFMSPLSIKLKFCFPSVKIDTNSKFLYHTTQPVKKKFSNFDTSDNLLVIAVNISLK